MKILNRKKKQEQPTQPNPARRLPPIKVTQYRFASVLNKIFVAEGIKARLELNSRGARHMSFGIRLQNPTQLDKALKLAENVAYASRSKQVIANRDHGSIIYQFQLGSNFWETYTRQHLKTPEGLGLADSHRQIDFGFSDYTPHFLIAGATGSGKTETVKSALLALLTSHTPAELQLVIIDPRGWLSDFDNSGHLAYPIARNPEEIDNALQYANSVFAHRKAESITDAPRLVIATDETEEVMAGRDDRAAILSNLVNGRAYSINIVVTGLEPTKTTIPFLAQLTGRLVGRVTDATKSHLATGQAGLEAHKLTGAGDSLFVAGGQAQRLQVALGTSQDYDALPRAAVAPPDFEPATIQTPEETTPGRPKSAVTPDLLAHYLKPGTITIPAARDAFGISKHLHNLHKSFAAELLKEMVALKLYVKESDHE